MMEGFVDLANMPTMPHEAVVFTLNDQQIDSIALLLMAAILMLLIVAVDGLCAPAKG